MSEKITTISVKISVKVRNEMRKLKINPSKALREVIEMKIREATAQMLKKNIKKMKNTLDKISIDEVIEDIRENREGK